MVKSAVGCTNRSKKGSNISFYRFPADQVRRILWEAAVKRKNWIPTKYSWLCSDHFVGGAKSDDELSPAYIPTCFEFTSSPEKSWKLNQLQAHHRRRNAQLERSRAPPRHVTVRRRPRGVELEDTGVINAANALLQLRDQLSPDASIGNNIAGSNEDCSSAKNTTEVEIQTEETPMVEVGTQTDITMKLLLSRDQYLALLE